MSLLPPGPRPSGNNPGDVFAVTRDGDFLALLDEVEQMAELVLCLEGADDGHESSASWIKLA